MTDEVVEVVDEVAEAIENLARPAQELEARLAAREAQLDAELKTLKEQRRILRNVLKAVDPETRKPGPLTGVKRGLKPVTTGKYIGRERLAEIRGWLNENADKINENGGMNRKMIFDLAKLSGRYVEKNQTSFMYGLRELHDIGFIRLDHSEEGKGGPHHFFKVNVE